MSQHVGTGWPNVVIVWPGLEVTLNFPAVAYVMKSRAFSVFTVAVN